jgi:hypothetical protein
MTFLRALRFFGSTSLLDWVVCAAFGHDDVFDRGVDFLCVRCLRCGRLSAGISLSRRA